MDWMLYISLHCSHLTNFGIFLFCRPMHEITISTTDKPKLLSEVVSRLLLLIFISSSSAMSNQNNAILIFGNFDKSILILKQLKNLVVGDVICNISMCISYQKDYATHIIQYFSFSVQNLMFCIS